MIFVDWLSVYQDFPDDDLPQLAAEIRTYTCAITGELLKETTTGYKHEGSFDTSLIIKFDGRRLYMSGNPSAWCRRDNLFGCRSVKQALDVYNEILTSLGYPQFYDDDYEQFQIAYNRKLTPVVASGSYPFPVYADDSPIHNRLSTKKTIPGFYQPRKSTKSMADGLTFTRIDLTQNFASPIPAVEMLRYLSSFNYRGQHGYLYPNGRTVEWLGERAGKSASKRLYMKYYDKVFDLEEKLKSFIAKRRRHEITSADSFIRLDFLDSQIKYLTELIEYSKQHNIIRFELELKSKTLSEHGLHKLRNWSEDVMVIQLNKYLPHIKQVVQFNSQIDIYSQLIDLGVSPLKARNAASLGQMWLDGHDVNYINNNMITKSHFYNVRKILLQLGYDIASPLNVVNFPKTVQTVSMTSLTAPGWYNQVA